MLDLPVATGTTVLAGSAAPIPLASGGFAEVILSGPMLLALPVAMLAGLVSFLTARATCSWEVSRADRAKFVSCPRLGGVHQHSSC